MKDWTSAELKKISTVRKNSPWLTENQVAGMLSRQLSGRSTESIRWQLRQMRGAAVVSSPNILLLDVETLPMEAYVWSGGKQYISPIAVKKEWSIVCWAAKWLFQPKVFGEVVSSKEAVLREDASILQNLWRMMDKADMIVWHNGNNFDGKKVNSRFLVNGFSKPMFYKSIDTLQVLRDNFGFAFNKMGYINSLLGIETKMETSFTWWKECAEGNPTYLKKMLEYNKHDVNVLEELYLKLRPWVNNHPNVSIFLNTTFTHCPVCSSPNLDFYGRYTTPLGMYRGARCQDCGSLGRCSQKWNKIAKAKVS